MSNEASGLVCTIVKPIPRPHGGLLYLPPLQDTNKDKFSSILELARYLEAAGSQLVCILLRDVMHRIMIISRSGGEPEPIGMGATSYARAVREYQSPMIDKDVAKYQDHDPSTKYGMPLRHQSRVSFITERDGAALSIAVLIDGYAPHLH